MDTANIFHVNTSNLSFNLLLQYCRFAIDTMQSVCLDEFGGEKAVHPSSQETTLIQHIFGGHLQSQVGTLSHIHKFVFVVVLLHSDAVKMLFAILDKYKHILYWLGPSLSQGLFLCCIYAKFSQSVVAFIAPLSFRKTRFTFSLKTLQGIGSLIQQFWMFWRFLLL